jgi:hypothetical protein
MVFLAVDNETGLAGCDGEAFFLVRVDVLGDNAPGRASPAEADELSAGGVGGLGELDELAGGWVEECSEVSHGAPHVGADTAFQSSASSTRG